jgi:hypothetical protein
MHKHQEMMAEVQAVNIKKLQEASVAKQVRSAARRAERIGPAPMALTHGYLKEMKEGAEGSAYTSEGNVTKRCQNMLRAKDKFPNATAPQTSSLAKGDSKPAIQQGEKDVAFQRLV